MLKQVQHDGKAFCMTEECGFLQMLNRVQHDAFCNSNPTPDWRGAGVHAPLSVADGIGP